MPDKTTTSPQSALFEAPLRSAAPADIEDLYHEVVVLRERGGEPLSGEIFLPEQTPPASTFLYLHGGGWSLGAPGQARKLAHRIAQCGFLVLSLDYGLSPVRRFPWALEDTRYGALWLFRNAARYGADGSRPAIGGQCAGANLAAAAIRSLASEEPALMPGDGDEAGDAPKFAAAVFLAGLFDLVQLAHEAAVSGASLNLTYLASYLGPDYLDVLRDPLVSPARGHIHESFPATFLACGAKDALLGQTLTMTRALARSNIPTDCLVLPELGHDIGENAEEDSDFDGALARILRWLRQTVDSPPPRIGEPDHPAARAVRAGEAAGKLN